MAVRTDERSRPRIEGEREEEIFATSLRLLAEVGYDRLTMDAVATAAKASKATLYRRWASKADLVVDAVSRAKACPAPPVVDTGTLRGDLLAMSYGIGGLTDTVPMSVLVSLVTALPREPELADAFHRLFLGPRLAVAREVFERAKERGETSADVDPQLLASILPAVVIHHQLVLQAKVDEAFIERVVDEVVLPACRR
ncbi:MAG TPA: TetR-like C-terminal domain-containing protein [Actinomycetales bacterium]|nr:TetR-like C-terminal domain-containing protein [Actinomycetales bacterium]